MPSGVDWSEPLKHEGVEAGLPRELGILMAADMRAKLDRVVAKGREYVSYESGSIQGYDYALCTQNALNLSGQRWLRTRQRKVCKA